MYCTSLRTEPRQKVQPYMRLNSINLSLVSGCAFLLAGLVSCVSGDSASSGAALYQRNCVICHGSTGAGDGAQASELPVQPANLRHLASANDGVFPTGAVMATIYGYRGKDYAGLMPEFGPLLDGPDVIWTAPDGQEVATPSALLALTRYLETIQDP